MADATPSGSNRENCSPSEGQESNTTHQRLLHLERCLREAPTQELRQQIKTMQEDMRTLGMRSMSLSLNPISAVGTLIATDLYQGELLQHDEEFWLPKGNYQVEVRAKGHENSVFAIDVEAANPGVILLILNVAKNSADVTIDMGAEPGDELGTVATTADPAPKEFETLLADRYARAPTPLLLAVPVVSEDGESHLALGLGLSGLLVASGGTFALLGDQNLLGGTGLGVGAALIGVGLTLWLTDDDATKNAKSARLFIGPQGTALVALVGVWP